MLTLVTLIVLFGSLCILRGGMGLLATNAWNARTASQRDITLLLGYTCILWAITAIVFLVYYLASILNGTMSS